MKPNIVLGLLLSGLLPVVSIHGSDALDQHNIYQRIKDADSQGLSLRRQTAAPTPASADIVINEQNRASGGRGNDAASQKLFQQVDETKLTLGTYPELIKLLDNYSVRSGEGDSYTAEEEQEIDAFLDEAVQTEPMRIAFQYIAENLGTGLTAQQFRAKVEQIWFEIYTNHFGGRSVPFCSGFEHVFVGEGQYAAGGNPTPRGEISGYHNWVRFYLQEKAGEVDYRGHIYDVPAARMPANPCVITLRMIWNHDPDGTGGEANVELFKPKGGFFLGLSPECELAMGTVAYFEHDENMLSDDKRRTVIDGTTYDLVLYRSVNENGGRGAHIRSFYPVLIGLAQPSDDDSLPTASGPVAIVRALPNPDGDDETGEWVELANTSEDEIDLAGWELRDRQGGTRLLDGALSAGQTRRFEIPRTAHTMRMGNNGGQIRLFREQELMHEVRYERAASGEEISF